MELVFEFAGWLYDKDGKQATDFSRFCNALGVQFDFSRTESRIVLVCNTEARKKEFSY